MQYHSFIKNGSIQLMLIMIFISQQDFVKDYIWKEFYFSDGWNNGMKAKNTTVTHLKTQFYNFETTFFEN